MSDREGLADFLRRRREVLRPVDAGLPAGGRRRTPGLRREEVALHAGVSVDYYARLEQGRGSTPSVGVVTGIARALQCDQEQREHLFRLAGHSAPPRRAGGHVRPGLIAMGNRLTDLPVVIISDLGEILWCNPLGTTLFGELLTSFEEDGDRNLIRQWFEHPSTRPLREDQWDRISAAHVSDLRSAHTRRDGDAEVTALVEELRAHSTEFAQLWTRHEVIRPCTERKAVVHPEVGVIEMRCEVLLTPAEDVSMIAFFPREGTDAAEKLELLQVIGSQRFTTA